MKVQKRNGRKIYIFFAKHGLREAKARQSVQSNSYVKTKVRQ